MNKVDDPIAFELFKSAIFSIADEMALTVFRTSYSGVLKSNMDYSTALATADGRLVAQGLTIAGHLGAIPTALEEVMKRFGDRMGPGDVYALNDPFSGGMHLPDIFVFKPIYLDGERLAFAATVCHHTDVGGRVAGSNAADSTTWNSSPAPGAAGPDEPLELVNIQVVGYGVSDRSRVPATDRPAAAERPAPRRAYFGAGDGWLETPVLYRSDLETPRTGPVIIEEYDATCVVPPRAKAALDAWGNIVIDLP